jgi:hypothetical protein
LAGKVPAHRAGYGYIYRTEKVIEARTGRAKVLRAWWEIDELGPDGRPVWGNPAWVVTRIFVWLGDESRTACWVANKLNELGIRPPYRTSWAPKSIIKIASRRCYTGKAEYNANGHVPNPEDPLVDLTLGIKRTLVRPKPDSEKVTFEVPAVITEEQWLRANNNLRERAGLWQARQKDTGTIPKPDGLPTMWKTDVRITLEERQRPSVLLLPGTLLSMNKRSMHL